MKIKRLIRFTNFHLVYNNETFFCNILLQKLTFCNEENIYFENNTKMLYVHEFQIKGLLHNIESLQTYLIQYANRNLFGNEKQIQLFQKNLEKYLYLDSNMNNEKTMFTCETHVNENTSNIVKCIQHDFKDEVQNFVFNDDQLKIFDIVTCFGKYQYYRFMLDIIILKQ
jgi:hypothetical protein